MRNISTPYANKLREVNASVLLRAMSSPPRFTACSATSETTPRSRSTARWWWPPETCA